MHHRTVSTAALSSAAGSALLLSTACSPVQSSEGSSATEEAAGDEGTAPAFDEVSVHDPSVILAEDEYWVFGSHLASAKSEDLVSWEQHTGDLVDLENPLFDDVTEELSETLEWAQSDTLWAADVTQLADGRYYMYYNACRGDSPRSAMGAAVADSVDGPYEDLGIILRSGHEEDEGPSEDGTPYDAQTHPNVVDPHVFYDAEGELWMVYGSYSGGIFILEMDEDTGMPVEGQGYGEHLMGGNHSRIEAPYMMHDPESGYYYLLTTFGGLDPDGGYTMRVARSENPDGPFYDAAGNPMEDVASDPEEEVFDDASIEPYASTMMGNHLFLGSEEGHEDQGYVSPGHNSAYLDPDTGQMHLFFHTRFPEEAEMHQVRVHQMHFNADGWPVVAPHRYAGGAEDPVAEDEAPGDYRLITHPREISEDIVESEEITLSEDGEISGAAEGSWELTGEKDIELTVDGERHTGVVTREWDEGAQRWTQTFSVMSQDGVALWGSR